MQQHAAKKKAWHSLAQNSRAEPGGPAWVERRHSQGCQSSWAGPGCLLSLASPAYVNLVLSLLHALHFTSVIHTVLLCPEMCVNFMSLGPLIART